MSKKDIFLCIHIGYNASCALMINGEVVAASQEDRFTRKKNETGFPRFSIDYCLSEANISGRDVSLAAYTTVYEHPWEVKAKITPTFTIRDYHDYLDKQYYAKILRGESGLDYLRWLRDDRKFDHPNTIFNFSFLTDELLADPKKAVEPWTAERRRSLSAYLGIDPDNVLFLDHHTCHAYYGYFSSPYRTDDCAIVVLDGWGDNRNQSVWLAKNDDIELIAESKDNDIGRIYKMATLHLGMRPDEHEYKVLGLAPYAKHSYVLQDYEKIKNITKEVIKRGF